MKKSYDKDKYYDLFVEETINNLRKELNKTKIKKYIQKKEDPNGEGCWFLYNTKRVSSYYVKRFLYWQDPRDLWNYDETLLENLVDNISYFKTVGSCPWFMCFLEFETIEDLLNIFSNKEILEKMAEKNRENTAQTWLINYHKALYFIIKGLKREIERKKEDKIYTLDEEKRNKLDFKNTWDLIREMRWTLWS